MATGEIAAPPTRVTRQWRTAGRYVLSLGLFLAMWTALSMFIDNRHLLPGPQVVIPELFGLVVDGELWEQTAISMRRLVIGYSLAAVLGLLTGVLMSVSHQMDVLLDPAIELIRPVSGIAWIPLFLALFGVGDVLPIAVIFYAAYFPFVVNTRQALTRVPPRLIHAAQSFGADRLGVIRHVTLPAALPAILTGARIALAFAWASIVAAELIGSSSGVGFSIEWNRKLLRTDLVLAWIAAVGILGFLTDRIAVWAERRLLPWRAEGSVGVADD